jgi:hypothetical protein
MIWHGFGMYGMGGSATDPSELPFSKRVEALGVNIHKSPYQYYEVQTIAGVIDKLPPEDGLFVWGTSLGANNVPVLTNIIERVVDGAFGFQASIYGATGYKLNRNIKFAHLIWSLNPIPAFGLGAYKWPLGTMNAPSYHLTQHDIAHPGDYDTDDQNKFLAEMTAIMKAAT